MICQNLLKKINLLLKDIYERLWDLVIKFLHPDIFISKLIDINIENNVKHINVNINNIDDNINKYFIKFDGIFLDKYINSNWNSGNSQGFSDISFELTEKSISTDKNRIYFISSSKYYGKEKNISDYDIEKLCIIINKNKDNKIRCLLFIKDKEEFIKKVKNSNKSSSILIEYIKPFENNVFDLNDLKPLYYQLKNLFSFYNYFKNDNDIKRFKQSYLKENGNKQPLNLRFHQKLFINEIREIIKKEKKTDILIGAVPRCGKTYIMGGIILDYLKNYKKTRNNFIIITSAPSETINQYKEMFNNYLDFEINNIKAEEIDLKKFSLDENKNNVILISIQKLVREKTKKGDDEIIEILDDKKYNKYINLLKDYKFDIIFIDEAHYAQTTDKAIDILKNKLKYDYRIFTTATFRKPTEIHHIKYLLYWNLENSIKLKRLNKYFFDLNEFNLFIDNNLINNCNFSKKTIYDVLKEFNVDIKSKKDITEKILSQYKNIPEPLVLTTIWKNFDDVYKHIELAKDSNYSFDMNKIFSTNKEDNLFVNQEQAKELFCYYLGIPRETFLKKDKQIEIEYKYRNIYNKFGIVPRIKSLCNNNCRTLQQNIITSQLWFLPFGIGGNLINIMNAIIFLLKDTKELQKFYNNTLFILAKGNDKELKYKYKNIEYYDNSKGLKEFIIEKQKKLSQDENNSYKNLVILTGFKLHLGVSLPGVDIVVLFNQLKSIDLLYQMMFRSMTEDDNKKYGFIIDLNPQRNMAFLDYDFNSIIKKKDKEIDKETRRFLITDLFNIDRDMFIMDYDEIIKNKDDLKKYEENMKKYSIELFNELSKNNDFKDKEFDFIFNDYFDKIYKNKTLMNEFKNILKDFKINKEDKNKIKRGLNELDENKKFEDKKYNEDEDDDEKYNKKEKDNKLLENKIRKYFKNILHIISFLSIKGNIKDCCYITEDYKKINKEIIYILENEIENNKEIKEIFIYTINDRCGLNLEEDIIYNNIKKLLNI